MNNKWQQIDIGLAAAAASLLLSFVFFFFKGMPNDDAYTYLRTAEIFLDQGLSAAIANYSWVSYPVLIALLGSAGFSLLTAAYVLNALFYALIVYSFVNIVRFFDDSRLLLGLAALTVLVFPELNEYREMVVRDVGFWSLSLFGLWQFLQYDKSRERKHRLLFFFAMGLAALFRVEAVVYLLLTPLALLSNHLYSPAENRKAALSLTAMSIEAGIAVVLVLLLLGINVVGLLLDRLAVYQLFLVDVFNPDPSLLAARANAIFGEFAANFSGEYVYGVIGLGLLFVLAMTLFYAIGGPYFWLLVWGYLKRYLPNAGVRAAPITAYLLINLGLLLIFLYVTRFLTARYAILFALMIVLQVPFLVRAILEKIKGTEWQNTLQVFFILFFTYCAIDAYITFGRSKDWLMDAADYVSTTDAGSVITNNQSIAYFSGTVEDYDKVVRVMPAEAIRNAQPGDLIAIELFYDMRVLVENPAVALYLEQVAAFPAEGEAQVGIYRRVNP